MKTKVPNQPPLPAGQRSKARVTIQAELVDNLFDETIANLEALRAVWHKVICEEELQ